jgi:hypothetical protein
MKQETTLKEVAERLYPRLINDPYNPMEDDNKEDRDTWLKGAKWQQEQDKNKFSEEDLRKAFLDGQENVDYNDIHGWSSKLTEQEWFEQFKNKQTKL